MTAFWAVELVGHESDLAEVERALNPSFDPWVDKVGGKPALRSAQFDGFTTGREVRDRARILIDILNGAVGLMRAGEPVRGGGVYRVQEDGKVDVAIFAEAAITLRPVIMTATAIVKDRDGNVIPPPPPTPTAAQEWIQAAENDDDLADLLSFVGRADNWFDLYKAIEMAERLVGGKHKLERLLDQGASAFQNARETANWCRHARGHRPADLATLDQARSRVKHAVLKALEGRV